jgi:hypothetical protein
MLVAVLKGRAMRKNAMRVFKGEATKSAALTDRWVVCIQHYMPCSCLQVHLRHPQSMGRISTFKRGRILVLVALEVLRNPIQ